jgi:beta-lactamase superfamily II metal-dependent hydrolase
MSSSRKITVTSLIILLFVSITIWSMALQKPDQKMHIWVLDIGQGDSIYGRLPTGQDFLVDGGPDDKVLSELSDVMPFNDREINLVIATHNDADHITGLTPVMSHYKVDEIWINGATHTTQTYFRLLASIKQQKKEGATVKAVTKGDTYKLGDATMTALAPLQSWVGKQPDLQNDAMVVSKFQYKNFSMLLTGDMEFSLEDQLIAVEPEALKSTILKVGHHGSVGSTSQELLDAVDPRAAVISVGLHNRYGHPTQRTLDILKRNSIPTYRTDKQGRIEITSDGEDYTITTLK